MRRRRRSAGLAILLLISISGVIISGILFSILSLPVALSQIKVLLVVFSSIGLLTILYSVSSLKIIRQGYEAIVERLGRYQRTLKPGLNFVIPIVDKVLLESTREQILDIPPQSVITKDNVTLEVDAVLFWKIIDIAKAYYAIEDLEGALRNLILTALRSEIGKMELKKILSSRDEISCSMLRQLDQAVATWGVKVFRVEVQEVLLSEELRDALEKEQAAESIRRAKIAEANGLNEAIRLLQDTLGDVDGKTMIQYLLAQDYIKTCVRLGEGESSKVLFMDPRFLNESLAEFLNSAPNTQSDF